MYMSKEVLPTSLSNSIVMLLKHVVHINISHTKKMYNKLYLVPHNSSNGIITNGVVVG